MFPVGFFMLEPVKKLYNKKLISQTFLTLHKISKINKKEISIEELQEIANIDHTDFINCKYSIREKTSSVKKMKKTLERFKFLFKNYTPRVIGLFICTITSFICFNCLSYSSGDIG